MVYDGLDVPDVLEFTVSSVSSYGVESNASTASMLVRSITATLTILGALASGNSRRNRSSLFEVLLPPSLLHVLTATP